MSAAEKKAKTSSTMEDSMINRIPPYYYLHVLDQNTNVTRVVIGPKTYIRQENEKIVMPPVNMMTIPPRHFCIIVNPVKYDTDGSISYDKYGQAELAHGDEEIRFTQSPFPLYPGEKIKQSVTALQVVKTDSGLRLLANVDFTDESNTKRLAGDEWMFLGPGTYIPRKEVAVLTTVNAKVIRPNQALRLRARRECVDCNGIKRVTGEEWLVKTTGAYLPRAYEEVVKTIDAYILTETTALKVKALQNFEDRFNKLREAGEEWLININDTKSYIPDVYEEVTGIEDILTLTNSNYCVVVNPVDANGKPQLGEKKLVKGPKSFFLLPGELLPDGIQDNYVLHEGQALICSCNEHFLDTLNNVNRKPGDRWMISGPIDYVPPVEVEIIRTNESIALDENEGLYIRNMKTGKVRLVSGTSYILNENEELWEKDLPSAVEELLSLECDPLAERGTRAKSSDSSHKKRNKTLAVTYRVPHNAAVQIYDYKQKKARVTFGPDLVMLQPDEQFTQLRLSGGKPKKPNMIRSLCLLLGPDFCTDIITVETSDHARLQLQLSYNWHFQVDDKNDPEIAAMLFSVPDFVGDACKAIASRIRGAVAGVKFDDFHKNSAKIIRASVFGVTENAKVREHFLFPQNNLVITNIDIQSVEPVDQRTRDALQKSVQLAIEITTNSQEANARHVAERLEQEAKGNMEKQKLNDEATAEVARSELLELKAKSAAVESTGQAKAEAQSRAEAARIEGEAAVEQAKLKTAAEKIESEAKLAQITQARNAELKYIAEKNALEVNKTTEMGDIQIKMFERMIESLGTETLRAIAISGQESQMKLLQALGIKSTLITDGSTPINLFNLAQGMVGGFINSGQERPYDASLVSQHESE
ncbi:major vault protein [Octopus bimaculoides]|uniref:Major vault protein n=1 Tax=Octopus bimaculoides TaxID=37653 RepID=A0A0L8HJ80_OCTBM|nr:major vault protein [Octopus bimaculoides]|eukprot:XP_014771874.1 PREDICTED: major vault protein-like [Octopus bimaculoides]